MPTARRSHSCGLVTNAHTGETEIVAAGGGQRKEDFIDTVEIFSLSERKWRIASKCF
jgi:acylphosphatase